MRKLLRLAPALLLLAGCRSTPTSLLLITLDTVRADRLGSYGSPLGLTPHLDRLASESVRFEDVTCQTPLTTPSHGSILTGLLPRRHGMRNNESFRLADSTATLATVLRAAGYRTAAFIGAFPLESRFGLARGFDLYDEEFLRRSRNQERRAGEVLAAAERFIREKPSSDEPFFVWIHLFDAHTPYDAPERFRERFPGDAYGAEIAYLDDALGDFFRRVPLDEIVFSVVADHGEGLGEHGEATHGTLLYESTLRVPWIVRLPQARLGGIEVEAPVRTIDVAPTLLGLLDAPALEDIDGVDLSPFLETGSIPEMPVFSESLYLHLLLGWHELRSLRRGSLKVVGPSEPELFDVERDPAEMANLVEERRPDAVKLLRELEEMSLESRTNEASPDAETAKRLAALGYLSGATRSGGRRRDPRTGMPVWHEIESGTSLLVRDRASARAHFERALALDPGNGLVLKSLGDLALTEGQLRRALELYRESVASGFEHPDLELGFTRALLALGNLDEAEEHVDRFLSDRPDSGDGRVLKGRVLRAQERAVEAEAQLRRALESMPEDASALNELGSVLAELGRRDEARSVFEQAMAAAPEAPEPRRNLARLLEGPDAERLRREAIGLDPDYVEVRIDLARQLAESGRVGEAAAEIDVALRLRPDEPEAIFVAARIAELGGQGEKARRLYERFLAVAPPELEGPREMAQRSLAALRGTP